MKRRIAALLMSAAMVASLAGCGGGSADTSSSGSDDTAATTEDSGSGDLIKVGIINNDPNESGYRTANDNDMKSMFTEENGYDASFAYSLKNDEQITAAQQFIQDGVDYLLLSAADTAGWDTVLQDAQNAGTRVILFDRVIDADESLYEAAIISDMDKEGETAVNWLRDQGLDEYNIIHIQGVMGSAAQQGRTGALNDAVESDGWNLVTQQAADWNAETAQQIVQSVIDSGEDFMSSTLRTMIWQEAQLRHLIRQTSPTVLTAMLSSWDLIQTHGHWKNCLKETGTTTDSATRIRHPTSTK